MNTEELDAVIKEINCYAGSKATNSCYYQSIKQNRPFKLAMHKYKLQEAKLHKQMTKKMQNASSQHTRTKIMRDFMEQFQSLQMQQNIFNDTTFTCFSPRLDVLFSTGCHHQHYKDRMNMINDIHYLLTEKPNKNWICICSDIYNGHVCFQCALLIVIRTNNLELFLYHIQKYSKKYQKLLSKRPMSFCHELMNLWTITIFFIQILNFPVITKYFVSKQCLFNRLMILIHWFIDNWAPIARLKKHQTTNENEKYEGYPITHILKHHEYFLELLYCTIAQIIFYWKTKKHIRWYFILNKQINGTFMEKYVIGYKRRASVSLKKTGYTWNMYAIFAAYFCFVLRHSQNIMDKYLTEEEAIYAVGFGNFPISNIMQRINQCHYRNFLLVTCNNKKCNKKYWNHVYQKEWRELRLLRNKEAKLPSDIRINKWYICCGCKMTQYCSRKCQKYDWNRFAHKQLCIKLQQTNSLL